MVGVFRITSRPGQSIVWGLGASVYLAGYLAAAGNTLASEDALKVNDAHFLELLGEVEGPGGYDTVTYHTSIDPPKPLTRMTIDEVIAFQRKVRASGSRSSAVGRFQFIMSTLIELVDEMDIDRNRRFTPDVQDMLARTLMDRCDFYDVEQEDSAEVADCLARFWAALPVATGENAGRSRYQGYEGNRSLVSKRTVLAVLDQRFEAVGISVEEALQDVTISARRVPLETRVVSSQ